MQNKAVWSDEDFLRSVHIVPDELELMADPAGVNVMRAVLASALFTVCFGGFMWGLALWL